MTPISHRPAIADIRRETADSVSIAFAIPAPLRDAYRFQHGQNVTLKAAIAGDEIRRCYSICSGVDEVELRLAVKKQEGGVFSGCAIDTLVPGHEIDVLTPT